MITNLGLCEVNFDSH